MKCYDKGSLGRTVIVRLDQGDDVLESIVEALKIHGISDGYIASAIGTLDYCVLHMVMTTGYPPVEHFEKWEDKPLELASIAGIIANGVPHLHTVISDSKQAYAGHLEPGCRILYLGEIVIQELVGQKLKREKSSKNINELVVMS